MNYFQASKYLNIIKTLGETNNPISFSELKVKASLSESTLWRGLMWLQNIQTKNSLKEDKFSAYYLKQTAYIKSTGKSKSKKNTYILTKTGFDLYTSLFDKKENMTFVDELIQEQNLYKKLWSFIHQNEELFIDRRTLDDYKLEPWTLQLFEFFEKKNENEFDQLLENIQEAHDLKLYKFFQILSSIILSHPLWRNEINVSNLTKEDYQYLIKTPKLREEFYVFGTYPEVYCLIKSDKLIKTTQRLIKQFLKLSYWKSINIFIPSSLLIRKISDNVIEELYKACPKYYSFLNDFPIDFSIIIKNFIREIVSKPKSRYPLNMMSENFKEQFEFNLNRQVFQSGIENVPSNILKFGASNDLIKEQIEILKKKSEKYPYDQNIKINLLEILVDNYSHELRMDLDFYGMWHINITDFIEELFEELLESETSSRSKILTLGFIFYNNKFHNYSKALKISEELLAFYNEDENFLEILLLLYFKQDDWDLEKIEKLGSSFLDNYPNNINFRISTLVVKIASNKGYIKTVKYFREIDKVVELEDTILNFHEIINFFVNQCNRKGLTHLSLGLLEDISTKVRDSNIRLLYARELLNQQFVTEALTRLIYLIDAFPNSFIESEVINQFILHYKRKQIEPRNDIIVFLEKITNFLVLTSNSIEWHVNNSNLRDFKKSREVFLLKLRTSLKELELLLKNDYCLSLPLKIKANYLKALGRYKNLESCLIKLLDVSSNSIWANTELALLYSKQGKFREALGLLQKIETLKEIEHYSIPYYNITQFSHFIEINNYNLFQVYKDARHYHEAIVLLEEYLLNPPAVQNLALNPMELAKNLIDCYWKESNNLENVIEKTLKLINNLAKTKNDKYDLKSERKSESYFLRQTLIDFIFNKKNYSKCLEWLTKFNIEDSNLLEPQYSFMSPFNKNTYYLAECYLKLNNLILAKKYFTQALEDLEEDIRFKAKTKLFLINPFPDYLRVKEKTILEVNIKRGIRIIGERLKNLTDIGELIFKTNIEKSIGNISLLIKEHGNSDKNLFQSLRDHTELLSSDRKWNVRIVVACACAINGYLDEMNYYISQKDLKEKFPIVSKILKLLYLYYHGNFKLFNTENKKLSIIIPHSSLPLILNLHYLRYKKGSASSSKIKNLFISIWKFANSRLIIYGDEKTLFGYLKNNLLWYPFKWALDYEDYVKNQQRSDIKLLFKVLNFVEGKRSNVEEELIDFITFLINPDRELGQYLSLIMILKRYKYPKTKYYLMKLLKLEIGEYGLETYGEIAYAANKLHKVIKDIENFKEEKIRHSRRFNWIEEKYLLLLLTAYQNKEFDENKIPEVIKRFGKNIDVSDIKMKYIKTLFDLKMGYYEGAELKAYQLLLKFKEDISLEWKDEYFRVWIVCRILWDLNQNISLNPITYGNEIIKIFNFEKTNKKLIHYQLEILEILDHELFEDYKENIINFGAKLFMVIINVVDWKDNKTLSLLAEKIFFKRDIFCNFDITIIESINKLINNLNPTSRFTELHKNYLAYVKSRIFFKNGKKAEAKQVIEGLISTLSEKEIYTTFDDVNDFYLEFQNI